MTRRRWLHALTLLLLAAAAAAGFDAYLTYASLHGGPPAPSSVERPAPAPAPPPKEAGKKRDYRVIVQRNLFSSAPLERGRTPAAKAPAKKPPRAAKAPSEEKAPAKPLPRFRLVGTTVVPGGEGFAILEDLSSRKHTVHRKGEWVRGALIQEVRRGEVQLLVGGRVQILRAFEEGANGGAARRRAALRRPAPPPSPPSTPASTSRRILPRARVERVLESEGSLGKRFRAEVYLLPDGGTGLRLFPLKKGGVLGLLGLRAGDVVLGVDGNPVRDAREFLEAVGDILEGPDGGMEILRGGRKIRLAYRIQ